MLAMLSMMGGKAISKYVVLLLVLVGIISFSYILVQKYNNAIEKAVMSAVALKQANSETETANENNKQLTKLYVQSKAAFAKQKRISRKNALEAKRAATALNNDLTSGNSAAVNKRLCMAAESIQGEPIDGCGTEVLCTGSSCAGSDHVPSYKVTDSTVKGIESALRQCGVYINTVENNLVKDSVPE